MTRKLSSRVGTHWVSLLMLPAALAWGCAPLEPMHEAICGNQVLEAGEECDTHAEWPGAVCKPPGDASAQCVYACSADGADGTCPPGFFCSFESRCVTPNGTFTPTGDFLGTSTALLEVPVTYLPTVVMLGNDIGDGRRAVTAYDYLDFPHASGNALPVGFEMASPTLWPIGPEDVALEPVSAFMNNALAFVGEHGIQALKRTENYDPNVVSIAMPAEQAKASPSREVRVMSVLDSASARVLDGGKSLLELEDSGDSLLFRRVDRPDPPLLDLSWTRARLTDVSGGVVLADWDARPESPCREVVVPLEGLDYLLQFSPCVGSSWAEEPAIARISLPEVEGARSVVAGPAHAMDVDRDGRLDVVVSSSSGPCVAYGLGDGTFSSLPDGRGELSVAGRLKLDFFDETSSDALPFDGADLNADGYTDYALPGGIALSQKSDGKLFWAHRSAGWADAKIDRQRGRVIATSLQPGVEVLTYLSSAEQFVRSRWATVLPASQLTLGDFDGDATTDVAFAQSSDAGASVWVALGGPRSPEQPAKIASFAAVSHLEAAYLDSALATPDAVGDLVVSGRLDGEGETFSFLHGNANGQFDSPLVLRRSDGEREIPLAVAASAHATSPAFLAAVSAAPGASPQRLSFWAFNPNGELGPSLFVASEPLSEGFMSQADAADLRYGAQLAANDLDGDGVSDLVLLAPFEAPAERSALVVGRLEGDAITTEAPLVLDAAADALTRLRLADIDRDGSNDLVLRPSGAPEPPLWIFWNDGSGHFSRDALTELHPPGGVNDFTCEALSHEPCALLVVTPEGVFRIEAQQRDLAMQPLADVAGGQTIAAFNYLDTSSLLIGGPDSVSAYQGGTKHPGLLDAAMAATP